MPIFAYQATDATGRDVSGTVDAADRASAVRQLSGRGLQPFKVQEGAGKEGAKSGVKAAVATKGKSAAHQQRSFRPVMQPGYMMNLCFRL